MGEVRITDEKVDAALLTRYPSIKKWSPDHQAIEREKMRAALEAALSVPAQGAEPVAWRAIWISDRSEKWILSIEKPNPKFHHSIQPLYARSEA